MAFPWVSKGGSVELDYLAKEVNDINYKIGRF